MKNIKIGKSITPHDSISLNLYFKDVNREELISKEREIELAARIKEGDEEARNELVTANMRFVISVAKQYQGRGLMLEDLIAEGNIGLLKAAEKFDASKGFRFISYAVWWIRQSIIKAIYYTADNVRLPTSQIEPKSKLSKIINDYEQEHGCKPTMEELMDLSGFTEEYIRDVQSSVNTCISIDAPSIDDTEDCTIGDCIPNPMSENPERLANNTVIWKKIKDVLDTLNNRDHDIICMVYGLNGCYEMSYEEIARKFALSAERIRQINQQLLKTFGTRYRSTFAALL